MGASTPYTENTSAHLWPAASKLLCYSLSECIPSAESLQQKTAQTTDWIGATWSGKHQFTIHSFVKKFYLLQDML
ncbi:unnamed protein product [Acanthoscelides obtectus]|uniref:Uncharacterized protein n=1 Tax=Acanthoscelides obtectus TaxID=200917 RepID=A0A9P0KNZ8_ACAOB|nr:unnamed protein product [Acanthoscelides obtectus]CAK1639593.1 hypothetical protein AOBTE_LOCUS11260 [Acanthoscelides obtectus]